MINNVLIKGIIAVALAAALYFGLDYFGIGPDKAVQKAAVPEAVDLSATADTATNTARDESVTLLPLPSTKPAAVKGPQMRVNVWFWNAMMAYNYANGGPVTTTGSLMEKHGVNLKITRQDDTEKTKAAQVQLAQALHDGDANPTGGTHYAIIMGDGGAQYLAAVNKLLDKLGPEYRAEILGSVGYSRGEDSVWGPAEWRDDPQTMRGGLCAAYLRDGDWNLMQYYLAQNGIKNNPDETTYDEDAMNWVAAADYLDAVKKYVSGYTEERVVAKDGRKTSDKVTKEVKCAATWTPGDVNLAKQKGGLVRLISTKENPYQMPAVIIGIKKWDVAHPKQVEGMLQAAFEGADQVRNYDEALKRGAAASYAIYAEQSAAWILKYYKGTIERDKTQQPVPLGGSTVSNLADNLLLFGLSENSGGVGASIFKATYEGFGNVAKQQYPRLIPSFPPATEAVNTTFLENIASRTTQKAKAEVQEFEESDDVGTKVASRDWSIQFDTGKATFSPAARVTLDQLYDQLVIGAGLSAEIAGHTDNVGNQEANLALSQARAEAVRSYLQNKSGALFPANRVITRGYGDTKPIADNGSPEGRAKNRRVTVVLGSRG